MNANVNFESNADMSREPNPSASTASASVATKTRPFYWSLRRELWENRSIYIAPAAVAVIVLISALINIFRMPDGAVPFQQLEEISPQHLRMAGISLYAIVSVIFAITAGIVGWFYCLDALFSERRERSVLFWKSLPISDTTTVLSKVLVGMGIVPLVALCIGMVLYLLLIVIASIVLMAKGVDGALLIASSVATPALFEGLVVHVYAAVVAILWCAPLYAWAIFVSSWVRRATFLWALLPPAAVSLAEGLAFGTQHFATMMSERFSGGLEHAFIRPAQTFEDDEFMKNPENFPDSLFSLVDPANFFSQPGLWIGLAVAAAFIAASIWMRRYREPL